MRGANNICTIIRQEAIGLPVHRVAKMLAMVMVRKHTVALPYDETLERPITVANSKLARVGIAQFVEPPNRNFLSCFHL